MTDPLPSGAAVADPGAAATQPDSSSEPTSSGPRPRSRGRRLLGALSFRNASAIWVFALIFVVFAVWVPDTFLLESTWRTLLDNLALTGMVAVALVIPLAAGAFDLAIGAEVGFGAMLVAWLLSSQGIPIVPAIVLTILGGMLIGIISGLLIVKANIDSFIATLGLSSVLLAMISWLSDGQQILGLGSAFQSIGTTQLLGVTLPVYFMLVVAFSVWYLLERTPAGRRIYATGGNIEAARLAGVNTSLVIVASLALCGAIVAAAGLLITSRIATGDPTVGPSYLLPAFSAAFLGSTQFKGGRFNVWGTIVAVIVLATGVKGLQLAGAPFWIPEFFNGMALLIAVGIAKYEGGGRGSAISRLISRKGASKPEASPAG